VVWGNGAARDSACPIDSVEVDPTFSCGVIDASLDWLWLDSEAQAADESVLCCNGCLEPWDAAETMDGTTPDAGPALPAETGQAYHP
jgi:hypothetical protein